MGYRVEYQSVKKVRGVEKRIARTASLTALFFVVFLLLVTAFWPSGAAALRELILPEDVITVSAVLEDFAEELEDGVSIVQALQNLADQARIFLDEN